MVLYILTFTFLDSRRDDKRLWTEWKQAFPELSEKLNRPLIFVMAPNHHLHLIWWSLMSNVLLICYFKKLPIIWLILYFKV
jgi:hypothetical protein